MEDVLSVGENPYTYISYIEVGSHRHQTTAWLFLHHTSRSSQWKPSPEDISTMIVPLHNGKQSHWTVVIFERHRTDAQHLNLFPSLKSTIDERHFHQCIKTFDEDCNDKVILPGRCPVQANGYGSGVHVLTNALYYIVGIEASLAHDCALWRRICRAILSRSVDEVLEGYKPLDMSAYSAELIWKKASLGSPEIGPAVTDGSTILIGLKSMERTIEQAVSALTNANGPCGRPTGIYHYHYLTPPSPPLPSKSKTSPVSLSSLVLVASVFVMSWELSH